MARSPVASRPLALLTLAAFASVLAAGCGADREPPGFSVVEELRGDTVVMVSSGEVERIRVEEAEVFRRSDELALEHAPSRAMARIGHHLVIGDRERVHLVSTRDGRMHSFGRRGEGPGEFRGIRAVGELGLDTIGVYDFDLRRVSTFTLDGELLDSYRVTPRPPFPRPTWEIHPLVRWGTGVLWTMTAFLGGDFAGIQSKALLWHDLEPDTAVVLDVRPWQHWDVSPFTGQSSATDVFPDRVVHAIGSDGRVASGDPAVYCIRLFHASEEGVRMACRERARVPVSAGFNTPDLALLERPSPPWLADQLAWQNPVDSLPHFDRLLFSDSGDLWVRTYHEELAHTHPFLLHPTWGLWLLHPFQPTVREWEVFDPEGVLLRQVTLPAAFELRVVGEGEAFGFLTLETGEVTIGRVDLTEGRE